MSPLNAKTVLLQNSTPLDQAQTVFSKTVPETNFCIPLDPIQGCGCVMLIIIRELSHDFYYFAYHFYLIYQYRSQRGKEIGAKCNCSNINQDG